MVIVDTSVAYKWTDKNEEFRDKALAILQSHINSKVRIIVPDLIFYELANAWATKAKLSVTVVKNNLRDLYDANLIIESVSYNLVRKSVMLSKKCVVSLYDAVYAVLAREKKCDLITADEKFAEQVNLPFVKKLSSIS